MPDMPANTDDLSMASSLLSPGAGLGTDEQIEFIITKWSWPDDDLDQFRADLLDLLRSAAQSLQAATAREDQLRSVVAEQSSRLRELWERIEAADQVRLEALALVEQIQRWQGTIVPVLNDRFEAAAAVRGAIDKLASLLAKEP